MPSARIRRLEKQVARLAEEEADNDDEEEKPQTNILGTAFNLAASIIGYGIVGIPYSLNRAGLPLGLLMLLFVSYLSDFSLRLIAQATDITGSKHYFGLMFRVLGKGGGILAAINQFLYAFISMIGHMIIIQDAGVKVLEAVMDDNVDEFFRSRFFITLVTSFAVMFPMSLYRSAVPMAKWSALSFGLLIGVFGLMAFRATTMTVPTTYAAYTFAKGEAPGAVAIITLAALAHYNFFVVFDNMREPTIERTTKVIHIAVAMAAMLFVAVGVAGYATFTGYTLGNILQNYCTKDALMFAARLFGGVSVMITYPMKAFSCKEIVFMPLPEDYEIPTWMNFITTVVLVGGSIGGSLITQCLGIVLQINGVINAAPLMLIYPPLVMLILEKKPVFSADSLGLIFVLIFGAFVIIYGLVVSVLEIIDGIDCGDDIVEPFYCPVNATLSI